MPTPAIEPDARPVIVGVDGSDSARNAVDWAADEAVLRGTTLELLHAWEPKSFESHDWYGELLHDAGVDTLQRHAVQARERCPGLTVTTNIVHEKDTDALDTASERAALLVVGRRGLGGFTGLLMGSVSRHLAGRSRCPLLVVPADERGAGTVDPSTPARKILVGIADATCEPAARAAFQEAARRGLAVKAITTWSLPPIPAAGGFVGAAVPLPDDVYRSIQRAAEKSLADVLAPLRAEFPNVAATGTVVSGPAGQILVDASEEAEITVVAAHRRAHNIGRTIGSSAYAVLHHAHSPVLLVPVD
ncbi:universal stress protein [Yinghuangia seranimata]|uniref:universal stress protein n=1 Tax=Yinghuangia seranimata TaxID=408067 RepID=UPI00248ABF87|nr:universal stress protein [Yinghuangia seranimata]MDI2129531.1 universal stress protein [Yinghuangia seranimata]